IIQQELRPQLEAVRSMAKKEEIIAALTRLNVDIERKEPPIKKKFENALFALQERANKPSRAPPVCKNPRNHHPGGKYFFASKRSRKYCSVECAQEAGRAVNANHGTVTKKNGGLNEEKRWTVPAWQHLRLPL